MKIAAFTEEELDRFEELVRQMRARVPGSYQVHVLLSAGILAFAQHHFDIVRAGLMLYGSSPLPNEQKFLRPVMTLKSRVTLLRDLPAGRSVSYGRTFTTRTPDAGGHDQRRLRRWLSALDFESRRRRS